MVCCRRQAVEAPEIVEGAAKTAFKKVGGKTVRRVEANMEAWNKENQPGFPNSWRSFGFWEVVVGFWLFSCFPMGFILGFLRAFRWFCRVLAAVLFVGILGFVGLLFGFWEFLGKRAPAPTSGRGCCLEVWGSLGWADQPAGAAAGSPTAGLVSLKGRGCGGQRLVACLWAPSSMEGPACFGLNRNPIVLIPAELYAADGDSGKKPVFTSFA